MSDKVSRRSSVGKMEEAESEEDISGSGQRRRYNVAKLRNTIIQMDPSLSKQLIVSIAVFITIIVLISVLTSEFAPNATIVGASIACWGLFFGCLLVAWPVCSFLFLVLEFFSRFFELHTIAFYIEGIQPFLCSPNLRLS